MVQGLTNVDKLMKSYESRTEQTEADCFIIHLNAGDNCAIQVEVQFNQGKVIQARASMSKPNEVI